MPKVGGLELLRYLRHAQAKMTVVILTAYGTMGSAVEAMKLGAVDFLEKPFDPKVSSCFAKKSSNDKRQD